MKQLVFKQPYVTVPKHLKAILGFYMWFYLHNKFKGIQQSTEEIKIKTVKLSEKLS